MSHLGIRTAREFATNIGMSRQVVGSTLSDKLPMSLHVKGAILSNTDVNLIWLETGEGEILKVPRADESDYTQVLRKEIELKNEVIRSKDLTITILSRLLAEREQLVDKKNRTIKILLEQNMPGKLLPDRIKKRRAE